MKKPLLSLMVGSILFLPMMGFADDNGSCASSANYTFDASSNPAKGKIYIDTNKVTLCAVTGTANIILHKYKSGDQFHVSVNFSESVGMSPTITSWKNVTNQSCYWPTPGFEIACDGTIGDASGNASMKFVANNYGANMPISSVVVKITK